MIIKKTKLFVVLLEISLIKFDLIIKIITKKNNKNADIKITLLNK